MFTTASLSERLTVLGLSSWWHAEVLDEVDSTNNEILRRYQSGESREGLVLFTERQTQGRGRRGATWHGGGRGQNLLFSCLLRPSFPLTQWGRLPHLTALAIAIAIEQTLGLLPLIKWPNDLILDGRKLGGILVETHLPSADSPLAIVGVGINVNGDTFPGEIASLAIALSQAYGREVDRCFLAAAILSQIKRHYEGCETSFPHYLEEIRRRSYLLGKQVKVRLREEVIQGRVEDLGEEGDLVLRLSDGSFESITSADEVRPMDS